jgi:hypothetical protein
VLWNEYVPYEVTDIFFRDIRRGIIVDGNIVRRKPITLVYYELNVFYKFDSRFSTSYLLNYLYLTVSSLQSLTR